MSEITLPPNWDGGGVRRIWRGVMATACAGWIVAKILVFLALGVGGAIGGASMVASGANIATSSDRVLLVMGTAAPSSGQSKYPGLDPFSIRPEPQQPPTPEDSVYLTRWESLLTFGAGLFVALFSLVGFGAAWDQIAKALGFYPYGNTPKKD